MRGARRHRPGGEIGRHKGLKIPRSNPCRFDSGPGHHRRFPRIPKQSLKAARTLASERYSFLHVMSLLTSPRGATSGSIWPKACRADTAAGGSALRMLPAGARTVTGASEPALLGMSLPTTQRPPTRLISSSGIFEPLHRFVFLDSPATGETREPARAPKTLLDQTFPSACRSDSSSRALYPSARQRARPAELPHEQQKRCPTTLYPSTT